jgi:hypothetical protein
MTDVQIAKLTGMETYCRLSDVDPKHFPYRVECCDYPAVSDRNQITALVTDGISMKKVKRHLKRAVATGHVSPLIKNITHSSCSHDSIAFTERDLLLWFLIISLTVIVVIAIVLNDGILDFVLDTNYTEKFVAI